MAGIVSGGFVGAMLLAATIGHRTSAAGILVGSASLAVVGGWLAFLCGSFYGIFRHGLRDALAERAPKLVKLRVMTDALPFDSQRLRHLAGEIITNVRELSAAGWTPATEVS